MAPETMTFECFLSIVGVDGEQFHALLLPEEAPKVSLTQIVRDATYGVRVDGATVSQVRTASHVRSLITQAQGAREAGGRADASSMVTSLTVRAANTESGESSVGKLTLVDLAAAEKGAKKGEPPNPAANASLASFAAVIEALASESSKKRKQVDFDGSKLTELLQDSLGGNSKSMMIVTVDPQLDCAPLTAQALTFGQKAREVKLGAASKNKDNKHTAMNKVNTTMTALTEHAGGQSTNR